MFGTALYHPHIDIHDPAWLRSAILFWDEIQTIVPSSIRKPYKERDTAICEKEGYISPLRCDLHGDLLNELGKRVIGLIQNPRTPFNTRGPNRMAFINVEKFGHSLQHELRLARMKPEKMSPELRAFFPGERQSRDEESEWILVDGNFANTYMSALAAALAREVQVSPLTGEEASLGVNLRCLVDDVADGDANAAKGALLTMVMKGL